MPGMRRIFFIVSLTEMKFVTRYAKYRGNYQFVTNSSNPEERETIQVLRLVRYFLRCRWNFQRNVTVCVIKLYYRRING